MGPAKLISLSALFVAPIIGVFIRLAWDKAKQRHRANGYKMRQRRDGTWVPYDGFDRFDRWTTWVAIPFTVLALGSLIYAISRSLWTSAAQYFG